MSEELKPTESQGSPAAETEAGSATVDYATVLEQMRIEQTNALKAMEQNFQKQLTALKPPAQQGKRTYEDPTVREVLSKAEENEKQLAELKGQLARERASNALAQELGKHQLVDSLRSDVMRLLQTEMQTNEDGSISGPDGLPLDKFVETWIRTRPQYLRPAPTGTGLKNTLPGDQKPMSPTDIQPGMSPDKWKQALAAMRG
jgi:ribosomal protein L29